MFSKVWGMLNATRRSGVLDHETLEGTVYRHSRKEKSDCVRHSRTVWRDNQRTMCGTAGLCGATLGPNPGLSPRIRTVWHRRSAKIRTVCGLGRTVWRDRETVCGVTTV